MEINRYPIYIVSKGRWDKCLTANVLDLMGVDYSIIIEKQEYDKYSEYFDIEKLLILPVSFLNDYETCDDLGDAKSKGPGAARNFAKYHSKMLGFNKHWVMDDNLHDFHRLHKNEKIPVRSASIFRAAEDFTDRFSNVPLSGLNYYSFCKSTDSVPPFVANTRIYSCLLFDNDCDYIWRGRYNEDTDLSLRILKDGLCTIQFNAFLCGKVTTQRMKGGNTEEFYAKEGTKAKSQMIEDLHPDVAKVVWRFNRWHHHVDYRPFKKNELILKNPEKVYPEIDDYGMKLYKTEIKRRYENIDNVHCLTPIGTKHTVYKTTNLINGKIYIGVHKTNDPMDDYLGSGLNLNKAIIKYGRENFSKEIIFEYDNSIDAYLKEAEIVNEEFIKRDDVYNICTGGLGGGVLPLEQEIVIGQFKKIHQEKYDYSLVEYRGTFDKVKIICPEHGVFIQKPNDHKNGDGCPKCGGRGLSNDEIIKQFETIHGAKYDYSLTKFKENTKKVKIICYDHGIFEQKPNNHKNGQGCPKCVGRNLNTKEIIEQFKEVHGDKYDYSLVKYVNNKTKVKIICSEHGLFIQTPHAHKNGSGCRKCFLKVMNKEKLATQEQVIKQFKKVHGDKYDYSLVDYINARTKVKIICPIHEKFTQTPSYHKISAGCPKCAMIKKKNGNRK